MKKETLVKVGEWAQARIETGEEPPWTYHKLKKLAELARELAEGLDASMAYAPGLRPDAEILDVTRPKVSSENIVRFEKPAEDVPMTDLPA